MKSFPRPLGVAVEKWKCKYTSSSSPQSHKNRKLCARRSLINDVVMLLPLNFFVLRAHTKRAKHKECKDDAKLIFLRRKNPRQNLKNVVCEKFTKFSRLTSSTVSGAPQCIFNVSFFLFPLPLNRAHHTKTKRNETKRKRVKEKNWKKVLRYCFISGVSLLEGTGAKKKMYLCVNLPSLNIC